MSVPPRIPILNRGIDVFSLPLSTKEGFVLSRIDDVSTVEDISIMVGIKLSDLLTMLERLADLGAVKLSWRVAPVAAAAAMAVGGMRAAAKVAHADTGRADSGPVLQKGEAHPAVQRVLATPLAPLFAEHEMDEPGELSEIQKRRVLNAFYGLAGKDYYQLLGVDQDADKKAIRAAYFEISRLFHPDSLFGKDLGSFKAKMEAVFKRLTEAYEVLGRNQRRKEYDDYLATTVNTSAIQHTLDRVDRQVQRVLSTAPPSAATPGEPRRTMIPQAHSEPRAAARSDARRPAVDPRAEPDEREPFDPHGSHSGRSTDRNRALGRQEQPHVGAPVTSLGSDRARPSSARAAVGSGANDGTRAQPGATEARAPERGRSIPPSASSLLGEVRSGSNKLRGEPAFATPSTPPRASVPEERRPALTAEERKAQARERLRRSFVGAPPSAANAGAPPVAATPPSAAAQPSTKNSIPPASLSGKPVSRDAARPAIDDLRQSLRQSAVGAGGAEPVLAHLRRAKEAELVGDLLGAAAALQAALTLQPDHKDIQQQYERVSKAVTRSLADNYEKQAQYEEKQSKWGAAAQSWERVSDGRPEDPEPARAAAQALLKASGDMAKAQRLAQRAVDMAPSDPANVVLLARVFLVTGQREHARRELEKAVKLDPQNEMIKNLLREAR